MDIKEFIEQDILIFLDDKIDVPQPDRSSEALSTIYLTRDYEKEMNAALERGDIIAAKQILHTLKDQFDTCPEGSQDKQQIKVLLMKLYEKLKDYLDANHIPAAAAFQSNDLPPSLAQQPTPPIVQQPPQTPAIQPSPASMPQPGENPFAQQKPQVVVQQPARTPDFSALRALILQTQEHIQKNELKSAINTYRHAKIEASNLPAVSEELTKQLLSLYSTIKQLLVKHDPSAEMDQQLILQLEQEKHHLDASLHDNNLLKAVEQYKRMRAIAQQIRNQEKAKNVAEKMLRIYTLLTTLKKSENERHLTRNSP